ncbi:putative short-chain dehydrogenase/reductase family 42E member 2 [Periophthalmus magnuspinnatus]|uniref:putative short-chain dehydrogenase/reductase family 42E member 2 n=1 Tax=Periophthalmus magnuspinnatus TaxID=409849 RepID=UPI0024363AE8|nr:putative short-chain dehydrogenase/reductase family 42E member 2 [Periophthalmus magnuspinnatus]
MKLCDHSMNESRGSRGQLSQRPCHSASCCLQTSALNVHNHLQPWVKHSVPAVASSPTAVLRHRGSGALGASCSSQDCVASRLGEEAAVAVARPGSLGKVLVTGGAGYFGFRLSKALADQGMSVVLLDMNRLPGDLPEGSQFIQSDIRDYCSLYKVCEGVSCIFHTASYGMTGPEQLKKQLVESINIGGTNNVIKVCKERNIPRLIYTSTVNVVFDGKPIEDGDETSVPYVPPDMHIDHYSRTKSIAEQMVLSANGCSLKGGELLWTCVLRPCGIYGPGERRHLHRVMVNVERRLFSFRFGNSQARMNWVHVDNLVLAHILASEALTPQRSCVASGHVYFINDGISFNTFEWFEPLFKTLGYEKPMIKLPFSLVYAAAILVEYLHVVLRPVLNVPLLFTRNEVRTIAVTHTFKIDKARRELGYSPKPYSLADAVDEYLKSRPPSSSPGLTQRHVLRLLLGLGLMLLLSCWALCQCTRAD